MLDIRYPPSENVLPFLLIDGIYTGAFIVSILFSTGLFLWGLFGKKDTLVRKIIGAELLLLFLCLLLFFSHGCFIDIMMFLHLGMNANMLVMYLCSYLFKLSVLSAVSLYKLILIFALSIKIAKKRKKPNQRVDPIVTTPVDKVGAQSTQGHP